MQPNDIRYIVKLSNGNYYKGPNVIIKRFSSHLDMSDMETNDIQSAKIYDANWQPEKEDTLLLMHCSDKNLEFELKKVRVVLQITE